MSMRNPQNERYTVEREGRSAGSTKPRSGAAKPASKAAASVRIETSPNKMSKKQKAMAEATMSKEEKRAKRAKERELENLVYTATQVLTNKDEQYKKLRRIWWGLLIGAVVFTGLSWLTLATGFGGQVLSVVVLVLAYAGIIGALIMDFTVIRKRRNVFRDRINAMSRKQVEHVVEESYTENAAREAGKKAKKEARKGGANAHDQQLAYDAAYNRVMRDGIKVVSSEQVVDAENKERAAKKAAKAAAKGKKDAEGTSVVTEVAPAAEAAPTVDDEAEAARKAAAAKAAREFAASKGHV